MIILRADNRVLLDSAPFTYLVDNVNSGQSSFVVVNTDGFEVDGFILIGDLGSEQGELFKILSVNTTSGSITIGTPEGTETPTIFAHSESTKVYAVPYNQVRFYWTAALGTVADENPEFDQHTPLTTWVPINPASWYTTYTDPDHATGFGWFQYRNSSSLEISQESNPIPYTGFAGNTAAQVFADFNSLLNQKELQLVTMEERFSWLNEALSMVRNKLNLNNVEYFVSAVKALNIVPGEAEYILDADFSDLVSITDGSDFRYPIPYVSLRDATERPDKFLAPHYYLRNRYIGFVPTPDRATTYYYRYRSKATRIESISSYIDLPDDAFYALKDFMMYRASLKFTNPLANTYLQTFNNSLDGYIQASVKRDNHLDSWSVAPWANT